MAQKMLRGMLASNFFPFFFFFFPQQSIVFILGGILLSLVFRIITIALWMSFTSSIADVIFNRLTWVTFTLTFLLLLFGWIETVHIKYPPPVDSFVPIVKWVFIGISVALVIMVFVTVGVWIGQGMSSTGDARTAYDANIYIFLAIQILVSFGFLIYGIILLVRLHRGVTNRHSVVVVDSRHLARQRGTFLKLVLVLGVMFVCFLLRGIMFILRPAGVCLPYAVFFTFAYIFPEIIPPIVQMFVIISTSDSKKRMSRTTGGSGSSGMGSGKSLASGASSSSKADNILLTPAAPSSKPLLNDDYLAHEDKEGGDDGNVYDTDYSYDHIEDSVIDPELRSAVEAEVDSTL